MTQKQKRLFGLFCLAFVALMTIFAFFKPTDASAVGSTHSDIIRVTVYDQYPSLNITYPETDYATASPSITVNFDYENTEYIEFTLTYTDEEGNEVTVDLPRFNPDELDPTFYYDSGSGTLTIDLSAYGLTYNHYILNAVARSSIGYAEDSIEFDYTPTVAEVSSTEEDTEDPVVEISYDDNVARIEITVTDADGNPVFDEPIVIEVPSPYEAGSTSITLPFSSYGLPTGTYYLNITSYNAEIDSSTGEITYTEINTQLTKFKIDYTEPTTPEVPNTGTFLKNLNIATSDYIITGVVAFTAIVFVVFILLKGKKKDYRKNYRNRR